MSSIFLLSNGGFKFTPTSLFSIFILFNLGCSIYDNIEVKSSKYLSRSSKKYTFKEHYLYGISALGTYELTKNIALGGGLTLNKHIINYSNKNNDSTIWTNSLK